MPQKKKINMEQDILFNLYIKENLSAVEIANKLTVSIATINRFLKQYNIKKPKEARLANVSKTKQAKTDEEKLIYSQHISEARKSKGLGQIPWNKGKRGLQKAWNKGIKMSEDFYIKVKAGIANMTTEAKQSQSENLSKALHSREPVNKGIPMSEEQKNKLRGIWKSLSFNEQQEILQKQYNTKKANNSFNSSKPEDKYYNFLVEKFGKDDIVSQYNSDNRYPFNCDFYIKSLDLYIELNLTWSHGGHKFDANNKLDTEKLAKWEEKAKTSNYYKNAVETWVVRDPLKFATAEKNNLNYLVFYTEEEAFNYEFN